MSAYSVLIPHSSTHTQDPPPSQLQAALSSIEQGCLMNDEQPDFSEGAPALNAIQVNMLWFETASVLFPGRLEATKA
jgi:hypothetical protein